jgi:hypothetical protein
MKAGRLPEFQDQVLATTMNFPPQLRRDIINVEFLGIRLRAFGQFETIQVRSYGLHYLFDIC